MPFSSCFSFWIKTIQSENFCPNSVVFKFSLATVFLYATKFEFSSAAVGISTIAVTMRKIETAPLTMRKNLAILTGEYPRVKSTMLSFSRESLKNISASEEKNAIGRVKSSTLGSINI